jgi:hypothetical protein
MQYKSIKRRSNTALKNKWFKPILGFLVFLGFFCSGSAFADELKGVMDSVKENFGTDSTFIKLLYAAEIVAGGYAWHKTKHPSAVIGIVILTLFMTFALTHWVFV